MLLSLVFADKKQTGTLKRSQVYTSLVRAAT